MSATTATPVSGDRKAASASQQAAGYADRPYERNLTEKGRRFISVDLDASLVSRIDQLRGKRRRGIILDELIETAIGGMLKDGSDHAVSA